MEYLFRTVGAPLVSLWDAASDAHASRREAVRRWVHSRLEAEEAKPPGARDEFLVVDLREDCMREDMEHWQVCMEAAGPLLMWAQAAAPLCCPARPAVPVPSRLRTNLSPPSPACCSLPTEADGLVRDPGPTLWLPDAARVICNHSPQGRCRCNSGHHSCGAHQQPAATMGGWT